MSDTHSITPDRLEYIKEQKLLIKELIEDGMFYSAIDYTKHLIHFINLYDEMETMMTSTGGRA